MPRKRPGSPGRTRAAGRNTGVRPQPCPKGATSRAEARALRVAARRPCCDLVTVDTSLRDTAGVRRRTCLIETRPVRARQRARTFVHSFSPGPGRNERVFSRLSPLEPTGPAR